MANRFWVNAAGGTWDNSTTANWSTTSGGGTGASVPGSSDTAVFDNNSGANTIATNYAPSISAVNMASGFVGTLTLGNSLTCSGAITLTQGTFNTNDQAVSCFNFSSSNSNARTLTLGATQLTLSGTGTVWTNSTNTNMTITASGGTSTIIVSNTSSTAKTLNWGANTALNNVSITGGGTGVVNFGASANAASFNTLTINNPKTVTFNNSASYTVVNFVAIGSSGNVITVQSASATNFNLLKTSGVVSCDWLNIIHCTAKGGATFYAGANSTNGGGNFGWQFSAQDSSKANFMQVL